jgi:hypothetical protein
MRRPYASLLLSFAILANIACAARTIVPVVDASQQAALNKIDWSDWGLTLSISIASDRVDYAKLAARPAPLDRFLHLVGRVGPRSNPDQFPKPQDSLAYYINCYNAVVVRSNLETWRSSTKHLLAPYDPDSRYRFMIDSRWHMPADLRSEVMKLAGDDWRVRFALCNGTLGGPPLNPHPFLPDMLDAQLNEATRTALASPQVVAIDHGEIKRLVLWSGLFDIRNDLVREYERRTGTKSATLLNVLLEWTPNDPVRRSILNSSIGYEISPAPTNRTPNAVLPSEPPRKSSLF